MTLWKSLQASIVLYFHGLSLQTRAVRTFITFYVQSSVNRGKKHSLFAVVCVDRKIYWTGWSWMYWTYIAAEARDWQSDKKGWNMKDVMITKEHGCILERKLSNCDFVPEATKISLSVWNLQIPSLHFPSWLSVSYS